MIQKQKKKQSSRRQTTEDLSKALEARISDIPATAQTARTDGLAYGETIAQAEQVSMSRELARLRGTQSGTANDIAILNRKVAIHSKLRAEFHADLQQAQVTEPDRKEDSWIVYGRVVDRRRLGLSGYLVEVTKGGKRPLAKTTTDERGAFCMTLQGKGVATARVPAYAQTPKGVEDAQNAGTEVLLRVVNKLKQEVYRDKKAMTMNANGRVFRIITIDGDLANCPSFDIREKLARSRRGNDIPEKADVVKATGQTRKTLDAKAAKKRTATKKATTKSAENRKRTSSPS